MNQRICIQCGFPVDSTDDAILLVFQARKILKISENVPLEKHGKHLRPNASCRGTPSLAQYFPGQARDPRPEYRYKESSAHVFQKAMWQIIQAQDATIPP